MIDVETDFEPLLPQLVDQFARSRANAAAVIAEDSILSYRELAERSDTLAAALAAAGVGPETLVGIMLERSVEMIVAVLAIWKAGGAYVPLDPKYPHDRLELMAADAALEHIISQNSTATILGEYQGRHYNMSTFDFSTHMPAPQRTFQPHQLAYVIYTSGSTGVPKGVMIEHASINAYLQWTNGYFSAECRRAVLAASSLSFDISVEEYVSALSCGGTLVIVRNLLDLIIRPPRVPVTFACPVPSPMTEVVRAKAVPDSLHTLVFAGEALPLRLCRDLYNTSNVQEIYNAWGVTEDTVISTIYRVPRDGDDEPPIGLAMPGRTIHLLDEKLAPVTPGTPGEIVCAGTGVGRGYLRRPELNAQRFVTNPFGTSPTMYRSGDMAVADPLTGNIKYIGRNDFQIKIHGFRVELGEIETVATEYPGVAQAVVIAKPVSGQLTIAMFVIPAKGTTLHFSPIRDFLAERLPAHMIPSTMTVLDTMPMGPTGKADRKALAKLRRSRPDLETAYAPPDGHLETQVAEMFAELLDINQVGVNDNFFALGGQSLLATRLVTEIGQVFAAEVKALDATGGNEGPGILLTSFFLRPTVADIAATLLKLPGNAREEDRDGIHCWNSGDAGVTPLFLLHGVIQGEAFYVWNLAQMLSPRKPFYAIAPHGYRDDVVPQSIEAMATDFKQRIQAIQPVGPYELAGYCNGGMIAYEIARQLRAEGETVTRLVLVSAPALNTRFAKLEKAVGALRFLPGFGEHARRRIFRRLRVPFIRLEQAGSPHEFAARVKAAVMRTIRERLSAQPPVEDDGVRIRQEREAARFRLIMKAYDAYVPRYFDGHVDIIWGRDDEYLTASQPEDDWKNVAKSFRCIRLPGDHLFIQQQPEGLLPYLVDHEFQNENRRQ